MDWTFGSASLLAAESAFNVAQQDSVYFGVGSFGSDDQMAGLGVCLRMSVEGVDRDLIVQSINTGGDVQGNQFDLQIGAGGFGANNRCAGGSQGDMMFAGGTDAWGEMYGGPQSRSDCANLPKYPIDSDAMAAAGDDLISLCEYSFDMNVRLDIDGETSNPTIRDLARVKCPAGLIEMTQLRRNDDPSTFAGQPSLAGFPNNSTDCQQDSWDLSYCLTRMMDCAKPSAGWTDNIDESLVVDAQKVVQTCASDGYSRIDVQCGCFDCNC